MKRYFLLLFLLLPVFVVGQRIERVNLDSSSDSLKAKYYFHEAIKSKLAQQYTISYELLKRCAKLEKDNPAYFYELSIVSYNLQKSKESVDFASRAYYADTSNRYYALNYVQMLSLSGKNLEAIWIYEKLLKSHYSTLEDYINLTYLFQRIGDGKSAIETLNAGEGKFGIQELISGSKIDIYTNLKDYSSASLEALKLASTDTLNARYILILFEVNLNFGYIDKARNYLDEAYALDTLNPLVLLNMCNFYLGKGEFDLFFKYLNDYQSLSDGAEEAYVLLSKLLSNSAIASKYLDSIQGATNRIDVIQPGSTFSADLNSQIATIKQDIPASIIFLRRVVYSPSANENIWERYLSLLMQQQQHDSIQIITDRLLNTYPENPFIPFIKSISLWQMKQDKQALTILEKYKGRISFRQAIIPDYLASMGDLYHSTGNTKMAFKTYDQVLKIKPDHFSVLNNYAYYLSVLNKRLDEALTMSRLTVDGDPSNFTYLDTYGWILYKLKRYSDAEVFIRKAIVGGSDENAEVLEHYGDVLFKLNRVDEAIVYWRMALKLEPNRLWIEKKINNKSIN
ncbi:tetratricopeptide repeat protein [Williamwhitmania taraxaci]|uniref:tetratricopeptide repeat protein n=1 Tax=Williamwhitmania taraxaci TaxID=1640674 RepID=UPI000B885939|nr:hypothetical protein [Williamwhitmania taraxaci]